MLRSVLADILKGYRLSQEAKRNSSQSSAKRRSQTIDRGSAGWHIFGKAADIQKPFDVAVVMPTVGRSTILDAVRSVFSQARSIRTQLLIGIDAIEGDLSTLYALLEKTPEHVTACLFYPGYSTSVRHGGLHPARDGGTLRSSLTYLANARYVAYLDDDNWWHEDHLQHLLAAIRGKDSAFSLRWFVHPETRKPVCEDKWESVGPGLGIFQEKFGGWVDPNCLMLDKLACEAAIRWWSNPLKGDPKAMSADRNVYDFLQRQGEPGRTNVPTVYYALQPDDGLHPLRLKLIGKAFEEATERPLANSIRVPPRLSLITTCKGRLHHLQQTLPRMTALPDAEVIVVDYGCKQGTGEWVRTHHPGVKVVDVLDDPGFCVARARNLGANAASGPWLLFIDADVLIDVPFADWFIGHANVGSYYLPWPVNLQAFGTMLCTRAAFQAVNGYDEAFRGWGAPRAWDLYFRLRRAGYAQANYPQAFVAPIEHGNEERTTFYQQKDVAVHHLTSQMYFYMKWDLEAQRRSALEVAERQQLMSQATLFAKDFIQTGDASTAVDLRENPEATRFAEWVIERRLVYSARLRKNIEAATSV